MNLKHKLQKNKNVSLLISELLSFSIKLLALATKLLRSDFMPGSRAFET